MLVFVGIFLLYAIFERLCLLTGQIHELVSIKALVCEDKDMGLTPGFIAFLTARGLGPWSNKRE